MKEFSKIESLNGIRGFAVLLVLLSHASNEGINLHAWLNFSGAGRYGVFLFFALSAFLLTRQFLECQPERNEVGAFIRHYFLRRFLRIFPLYIAALFCYYLLYKLGRGIYSIDETMLLKSIFLLDAEGIFWTIPVEFQYYFVLPVVALVFLHVTRPLVLLLAVAVFVLAWWRLFPPEYVTHLLPFLPIFILGSTAAYISSRVTAHYPVSASGFAMQLINIAALGSLAMFLVLVPGYFNMLFSQDVARTAFHEDFLLFALLSCALVLTVVHGNGLLKRVMESRFFVFWGNISFSAYLGHTIVLTMVRHTKLPTEMKWLVFMAITAGLSYLAFRFFELPLSRVHWLRKVSSTIGGALGQTRQAK